MRFPIMYDPGVRTVRRVFWATMIAIVIAIVATTMFTSRVKNVNTAEAAPLPPQGQGQDPSFLVDYASTLAGSSERLSSLAVCVAAKMAADMKGGAVNPEEEMMTGLRTDPKTGVQYAIPRIRMQYLLTVVSSRCNMPEFTVKYKGSDTEEPNTKESTGLPIGDVTGKVGPALGLPGGN